MFCLHILLNNKLGVGCWVLAAWDDNEGCDYCCWTGACRNMDLDNGVRSTCSRTSQWILNIHYFVVAVAFTLVESFSTNDESDYEHEIWKKVLKSMRRVSNLVRRTRRTTSLKWKVVVGKRVGLPTEKARKVDLIYFAGFKCVLEDCYKHQHTDIHSRFVLKIGFGLELSAPL